MATSSQRWAFTFLREGVQFRLGRLYETFWFSQSNLKWTLVVLYPAALFYVRWRAEHGYKYNVFVADEDVKPQNKRTLFGKSFGGFSNGSSVYLGGSATVKDLKDAVYGKQKSPSSVRAGCSGRMFQDSDNLAMAVRSFCRRDPRVVFWDEVTSEE
jgi:hypothetical protein